MLFALSFHLKPDLQCIGKDLSPASLEGWQLLACLAQPLLSFPVGISLLSIPTYFCKNFFPLQMQFQLGQRIKGQMVCLSIHPDCWIEIEIRLYASKVQNKLYNPSFYQSRKNKVCYFLHLSIQGLLKLHYGKGLNSIHPWAKMLKSKRVGREWQ